MRIEFDKMEGAGNDFVLIDNRDGRISGSVKQKLAIDYCRRCLGVGADGMIFVEKDPEFNFSWDFYNSDGSRAEMCGNGARCAARYAKKIGAAGDAMTFRTLAGPIKGEITPRGAKVQLTNCRIPKNAEIIRVEGEPLRLWFLNTGVPHAVVQVDGLEAVDVKRLGRLVRYHEHFAPAGTNVNFFALGDGNRLAIRTYERGVEDETLACGTGSVAASIAAGKFLGKGSPVTVNTRSGEEMVVYFTIAGDEAVGVFLEGGARLVFSGCFEI